MKNQVSPIELPVASDAARALLAARWSRNIERLLLPVASDAVTQARQDIIEHDDFASLHEAWAVALEEFEELWEETRKRQSLRDPKRIRIEAIQLAACAIRIAHQFGEESADAKTD